MYKIKTTEKLLESNGEFYVKLPKEFLTTIAFQKQIKIPDITFEVSAGDGFKTKIEPVFPKKVRNSQQTAVQTG